MVLPVGIFLVAAVVLYAGFNDIPVADAIGLLLGRTPTKHLGTLSGLDTSTGSSSGSATGTGTVTGGGKAGVVAAAQSALSFKSGYCQTRPYPSSLAQCASKCTDCSGFVTLCYKQAGLPDPNGANYNGSGFTGTLESHGKKTTNPQPGDLAFWSSPDHVAVVTGNGQIIGWGSPPGPQQGTISGENGFHASFLGYRTY